MSKLKQDQLSVLIRMHDPKAFEQLSVSLLTLAGQEYEKVEPIILAQRFSNENLKILSDMLSWFDWHEDVRPRVINIQNEHPADLRSIMLNIGIQASDSRFIAVLDNDDYCGAEHYSRLISVLNSSCAAISFSGMVHLDQLVSQYYSYSSGRSLVKRNDFKIQSLYNAPNFPMGGFVVDRNKILPEDLRVDESITYEEDYNIHLRIAMKYAADFSVAAEVVPALVRTVRKDGSNTILTEFDRGEAAARKRELRRVGRKANAALRNELFRKEFDPFVLMWVEPLPIRGGKAYNWIVFAFGAGLAQLPRRNSYGHIRVSVSARYVPISEAFSLKDWSFRLDFDLVRKLERTFGPRMEWNESSVEIWKQLMTGKGPAFDIELELLDKAHDVFPFQTILTWGSNGAVAEYARKHDLKHSFLELGPTRAPLMGTGHCDPFGVNGECMISLLPKDFELPELPSERWLATFRGRSGVSVTRLPTVVAERAAGRKVALIPLQLSDDANFLLYAPQYSSFRDFLCDVIPPLLAAGWVCLVRPHPFSHVGNFNKTDHEQCNNWVLEQHNDDLVWYDDKLSNTEQIGLIANVDALVTVNSSIGFEAIIFGTPVVAMGRCSFKIPGHMPELSDLTSSRDLERFRQICSRLAAFHLFHHFVPIGELFAPAQLLRRLEQAEEIREIYHRSGSEGLGRYLTSTVRTSITDYLTMGVNPVGTVNPQILQKDPLLRSVLPPL